MRLWVYVSYFVADLSKLCVSLAKAKTDIESNPSNMQKIIFLSILISFLSCKNVEDKTVEDNLILNIPKEEYTPQIIEAEAELPEYSLIKKEDISHRTSLNDVNAPINKRFSYKFLVSDEIRREQIAPLFNKLTKDIISEDNDIDDITIWLYSDKKLMDGSYDVAMTTWAPADGDVTKDVAVSNNRDSYKLVTTIPDNLEEYLNRSKTTSVGGLSFDLRKKIYQELANTETRAREILDKKYPYTANFDTDKYANKLDELTKKYEKEISKKYKIDDNAVKSIYDGGDENGWYNL
jgi:hypothetical protein